MAAIPSITFYLAHPLELRHEVRKAELVIEKETGINLDNPFYDSDRNDILKIDRGEISREDQSLNFEEIVEGDLKKIEDSYGIIVYIKKGIYSIGTSCECWHTLVQTLKPIFVVSPDSLSHPWVRYFIQESNGKGFETWEELKEFLLSFNIEDYGGRKR